MIDFVKKFLALTTSRLKLKMKYPDVQIINTSISSEGSLNTYSQRNQDLIVYNAFFKGKRNGFYCDIGANDPVYMNNTLLFEELGWRGLAFEPLSNQAPLWKAQRNATFFNYGLSNENTSGTLNIPDDNKFSTTLPIWQDNNVRQETVQLKVLADVFRSLEIKKIDFMSIDVEGLEAQVLEGINFDEVSIDVILIENNKCSVNYGDDRLRDILINSNFRFWGRIPQLDDIFVRQDLL